MALDVYVYVIRVLGVLRRAPCSSLQCVVIPSGKKENVYVIGPARAAETRALGPNSIT